MIEEKRPLRKRCKNCGRTVVLEKMASVETVYPSSRVAWWEPMCIYCARSYCDFMIANYAQMEKPPEVFVHTL